MKLSRIGLTATAAALLLSTSLGTVSANAQQNPGGCTQEVQGSPAAPNNRSGRQNSAAVLPSVIAVAVQNVAVPVTVDALDNVNLNVVCLNDTLNQNDVRILQDILNQSPILSDNSNFLNGLLEGSDINVLNGVQVLAIDLGTGDVFLLRP